MSRGKQRLGTAFHRPKRDTSGRGDVVLVIEVEIAEIISVLAVN